LPLLLQDKFFAQSRSTSSPDAPAHLAYQSHLLTFLSLRSGTKPAVKNSDACACGNSTSSINNQEFRGHSTHYVNEYLYRFGENVGRGRK
jgi:hypothetical protein